MANSANHELLGRAEVRAAVEAHIEPLVAGVVQALAEEIPHYAQLPNELDEEVRRNVKQIIRVCLALWVDGGTFTEDDVEEFRALGWRRALDGTPLDSILRFSTAGGVAVLTVASEFDDLQKSVEKLLFAEMMDLSQIVTAAVDMTTSAIRDGYRDALRTNEKQPVALHARMLQHLLDGRATSLKALKLRAQKLNAPIPEWGLICVLRATNGVHPAVPTSWPELSEHLEGREPLAAIHRGNLVVYAPVNAQDAIIELSGRRGWRGCLLGPFEPPDIAATYQRALRCLDVAPEYAFDSRAVLGTSDELTLAILSQRHPPPPGTLARHVLGSLTSQRRRILMESLDAYLETPSPAVAAQRLGIHVQTLRYRLRRIEELTGRSPRNPWDRLVLSIARLDPQ